MKEEWRPVVGLEKMYEISSKGRVKSLAWKAWNGKVWWDKPEKILKHCLTKWGYPTIPLKRLNGERKQVHIHTLMAQAFLGLIPDGTNKICVDHINFIRDDNRLENLQLLTNRENSSKRKEKGSSKYTGVFWSTWNGYWMAAIRIDGKKKHLGCFEDEEEAGKAYKKELENLK